MGKTLSDVLALLAPDAPRVFPAQLFCTALRVVPILTVSCFCVQNHVVQENNFVLGHRGCVCQLAVSSLLWCLEMTAVEACEVLPCVNAQQHEAFIDLVNFTNGRQWDLMQGKDASGGSIEEESWLKVGQAGG